MTELGEMLMQAVPDDDIPEQVDTCLPEYKALLERIVKGAEFISNIGPEHKQWVIANRKYEALCQEALRLRWAS